MKLTRFAVAAGLAALLVFSGIASGRHQANRPIEVHRISERVIVFNYLDVNVTAIAGEKGLVVVDTERSPDVMRTVLREIEKEFGRDDVLYIVNTHGHADHCGGNQVFPDSIIVGQENCPEFMRQYPANSPWALWSAKQRLENLEMQIEEANQDGDEAQGLRTELNGRKRLLEDLEANYKVTPPAITFRDSLNLDLGDLTLELRYSGFAHTTNDIFIYVPEEQLVIAGDLFNSASSFGFPLNQISDVPRVMAVMDDIASQPAGVEHVITGHGEPLSGSDFAALRQILDDTRLVKRSAARELDSMIKDLGIDRALRAYRDLAFTGPHGYYVQEEEFNTLGYYLMGLGRINEAVGVLTTALEHFPESALLYDSLGEAYMKLGEPDTAAESYGRSLELAPYNRNAEEMLKLLAARE